uniref:Uncharacterized protein n=1 Tax=Ditylenchus dipsaci TaxID=166011 RepID=A0A915ES26_9BILA
MDAWSELRINKESEIFVLFEHFILDGALTVDYPSILGHSNALNEFFYKERQKNEEQIKKEDQDAATAAFLQAVKSAKTCDTAVQTTVQDEQGAQDSFNKVETAKKTIENILSTIVGTDLSKAQQLDRDAGAAVTEVTRALGEVKKQPLLAQGTTGKIKADLQKQAANDAMDAANANAADSAEADKQKTKAETARVAADEAAQVCAKAAKEANEEAEKAKQQIEVIEKIIPKIKAFTPEVKAKIRQQADALIQSDIQERQTEADRQSMAENQAVFQPAQQDQARLQTQEINQIQAVQQDQPHIWQLDDNVGDTGG